MSFCQCWMSLWFLKLTILFGIKGTVGAVRRCHPHPLDAFLSISLPLPTPPPHPCPKFFLLKSTDGASEAFILLFESCRSPPKSSSNWIKSACLNMPVMTQRLWPSGVICPCGCVDPSSIPCVSYCCLCAPRRWPAAPYSLKKHAYHGPQGSHHHYYPPVLLLTHKKTFSYFGQRCRRPLSRVGEN